jgi:hypothetical protein
MRRAGVAAVAAVALALGSATGGVAGADPDPQAGLGHDGSYVVADSVHEVIDGGGTAAGGTGGGGGGTGANCWFRVDEGFNQEVMARVFENAGESVPEGVAFINRCRDLQDGASGTVGIDRPEYSATYFDPSYYVFWDGDDVAPGTPLDVPVLEQLWAVVEGQLGGPEPVVSPPLGEPIVIGHHTFVAVANPQYEVYDEACFAPAGLCVTIYAEPTLRFDPGDGSGVIDCPPEGTAYAPGRGSPAEQAAGGCAHVYHQHSVAGFPGRVEVVWDVGWTSTGHGGISGSFDPLVLPGGDEPNAVRVVDESQAVVDEINSGGRP